MRNDVARALTGALLSLSLAACAGPYAQVSVPIGPLGRVGVSVGSGGQVSGHVGVGTRVGDVSVGGGVDIPVKE
jgi:hypothetical protein